MQGEDELARRLWPWLSERLAAVGDEALALERRLERGEPCTQAYDALRARTEALGWLLGCVAEALGGAPPSPRREARGLCWMVGALEELPRAEARPLALAAPEPASPGVTRAQSWECACALWRLAHERPGRELEVRAEGDAWAIVDDRGGRWCASEVAP